MAHVNCPKCGERLNLPPIQEKRGVRCPACKHEFAVSPPSQPQPLPGDYTGEGTGVFGKTSLAGIGSVVIWTFLCMLVMGCTIQYYPYGSLDPMKVLKNAPFVAAYGTVPFLISLLPVVCIRPRNNWGGFAIATAGGAFIGLASQTYSSTTGSIVNGILVGLVPGTYWVSLFAIPRYNTNDVHAEEGRRESQTTLAASLPRRTPSTGEPAPKDSMCSQTQRLRKPSNRKDGRTMMSAQKALLLVGGSIIVVMCVIPPWHAQVNVSDSHSFSSVSRRIWTQAGYRPSRIRKAIRSRHRTLRATRGFTGIALR